MNTFDKAKILGAGGHYDSCGPKACEVNVRSGLSGIYYAKAEHHSCRIFKTLMDNDCKFDCKYCANSAGCKKTKVKYEPTELAKLFIHLKEKMDVKGLFISSAVSDNPDEVTEKMIESVDMIRNKFGFEGYIHFKVLPGTSIDKIKHASELADRMSINIEAPNKSVLSELSTCKDYHRDILKRQLWIGKQRLKSGQTTQMMVSSQSTDKEILKMTNWEYEEMDVRRVYYSAFRPIKGTAMEDEPAERPSRQNRLYNSDFLMKEYGFKPQELYSIMDDGMLPQEDPKLALAKLNIDSPIDINIASYDELVRVPGIGPKTASRIAYGDYEIRKYEDLKKMGVAINRAMPFIEINGKRQKSLAEFR